MLKLLPAAKGAVIELTASSHGALLPTDVRPPSTAWTASAFYRCLMLDSDALLACREALRAAVEFGTILAWFYVADRTNFIAAGTKVRLGPGSTHSACAAMHAQRPFQG